MKHLKIFITIIVLLGLSSCAKDIIDLTCDITGVVKDKDSGMPLSNCEVLLTPDNHSITTGSDGLYHFSSLDQGTYTMTFNRSGYISDTRSVDIKAGETATVEMLLQAKASFSLSENVYDFGDLESSHTFVCFNNSAGDCSYILSNLPDWAIVNKEQGTVQAGSNDSFTLTIDRSKVNLGNFSQTITVEYSGKASGTETLLIKMAKVKYNVPSVNTASTAASTSETGFNIDGTITATGGSQITAYGHCWSTSEHPTINNQCNNLGMTDKVGSFTSTVEGLFANTTYYVRAYATNSQGTAYGEEVIIKTIAPNSDIWNGQIASSFAGGSGNSVDPYIIKTGGQLLLMKDYSYEKKYFKLANDINLNNHNWLPFEFSGNLDGNGHTVSNLKISRETDYQGLFSTLNGTVSNLKINGVDISATNNSQIGALAGFAEYAHVSNCEIYINNIIGNTNVGGLIGSENQSYITNCKVSGSNTGCLKGDKYIGGITGYISNGEDFSNNHVNLNIEGSTYIGGCFGGVNYSGLVVSQCSYKGSLKGENIIGGIAGCADAITTTTFGSSIIACKSEAHITASGTDDFNLGVGGISGKRSLSDCYDIVACYSNGSISAPATSYGALVPIYDSRYSPKVSVTHCYSTIEMDKNHREEYPESASIYDSRNITQTLQEYYSEYANYWNFNNTWTWSGKVDGTQFSISCPKLAWE